MQRNEISFLGLIRIGCLNGLAYAFGYGLPLYCCCALWFGVVFPKRKGIS